MPVNQYTHHARQANLGIQSVALVNLQPRPLIPHIRLTLLIAVIAGTLFAVQAKQPVLAHQTAEEEPLLILLTRQLNTRLRLIALRQAPIRRRPNLLRHLRLQPALFITTLPVFTALGLTGFGTATIASQKVFSLEQSKILGLISGNSWASKKRKK